ncbi:hypothetical protein [Eleftheria terrae]|uniref:hypothetical protein n=1 Tax=Eleftheria terrae TaxID=1597781 RepID=UPI00263A9F86|nr:hypothetical protein [Eleftheria terrae]
MKRSKIYAKERRFFDASFKVRSLSCVFSILLASSAGAGQVSACGRCPSATESKYPDCSPCTEIKGTVDEACAALTGYLKTLVPKWTSYGVAYEGFSSRPTCRLDGTYYDEDQKQEKAASISQGSIFGCGDGYQMHLPDGICLDIVDIYQNPPNACATNPGFGKPAYPLTGTEKHVESLGIRLGGQYLDVTYNSARAPWVYGGKYISQPGEKPVLGQLGTLWWSSFHREVRTVSARSYLIARGDGRIVSIEFNAAKTPSYFPVENENDRYISFSEDGKYYRLYTDQARRVGEVYSSGAKQLLKMVAASGATLEARYSDATTPADVAPPGKMVEVRDAFGRRVLFKYLVLSTGDAAIKEVVDPAGLSIKFEYDDLGNMKKIVYQDGSARQFIYDSPNPSQAWALTGVVDERGRKFGAISYSPEGWVSSVALGSSKPYQFKYNRPPRHSVLEDVDLTRRIVRRYHVWSPPIEAMVVTPEGGEFGIASTAVMAGRTESEMGSPLVSGLSQPAGSGCAAATNKLIFDARGNVTQKDDFNGRRECYSYAADRSVEVIRVEGLDKTTDCSDVLGVAALPANSRKISTQWHPDWQLSVKVAEPRRIVTTVYNGRPDPFNSNAISSCAPATAKLPGGKPIAVVCKRVEQATTDEDGSKGFAATLAPGVAARQWSYTYNEYGQVLSEDGPRTDVADVTKYEYYTDTTAEWTRGDLKQVTDAAGQVTRYTRYNPHGQVLTMVDPNNVSTEYTYDLRQRLKSVSTGGQSTKYDYEPTGLLKQVTQPDGSYVRYSYDDAHRLTGISDGLGNSVTYTLNNAGEREKEEVKDPSGALMRNISRAYDALGRLQSVTGAVH